MREILFRGKRVDNGEWVYGYIEKRPSAIQMPGYGGPWYISTPPQDPDDSGGCWNVDPATVGQYTGLTDRVGKKIFEGDVVEGYDFDREDGYGFVRWRCGAFEVVRDGCFGTFLENYLGMAFKVIGNIHDNPELLEENPQ